MSTLRQEPTVYLLRPPSTRPDWRTCCQTLTTSSRSVPSTEPAWDLLENTARCSPREHVRGRQDTEPQSCCHNQSECQRSLFFRFGFQHLLTLQGCGATSPGLESGCTCGGTISSTTGLGIFPSRCTTRWVWRAVKLCVCLRALSAERKLPPSCAAEDIIEATKIATLLFAGDVQEDGLHLRQSLHYRLALHGLPHASARRL